MKFEKNSTEPNILKQTWHGFDSKPTFENTFHSPEL